MSGAITIDLNVNGIDRTADVEPQLTLADLLRDEFGLRGTKVACDQGACGACTVLIDDQPMTACSMFAFSAAGTKVTTIEGVSGGADRLDVVQQAFHDLGVPQCGFCSPGMVLLARAYRAALAAGKNPDAASWMSANICRCSGYGVFHRMLAVLATDGDA